MKSSRLLPLAATFSLASCAQIASTLQEPITSDYNPLDGPSVSTSRSQGFQPTGPTYNPGEWVETAMPNSTFFYKIPRGSASADQVLSKGSPLKVISTKGSYLKVELEGGTVGYVPTIMVAEQSSAMDSTPFLPPPPSAPLQRSTDDFAPASIPEVPLESSGSSLIPPPSNTTTTAPSAITPASPERKPTEILIPTTPVDRPTPMLTPDSGGAIPAPTGNVQPIDQSIGIE
ncbi:MAG: hypothetical protein ACSHYB_08040 [Roseibacillus sp.]